MARELPTNLSFTIPLEVMMDRTINLSSRVVYAEILAMSMRAGYCWASNAHFAEVLGVTERTISRAIAELVAHEYVAVENPQNGSRRLSPLRHIVVAPRQNGEAPRQTVQGVRQSVQRRNYIGANKETNKIPGSLRSPGVTEVPYKISEAGKAWLEKKDRLAAGKRMP